MGNSQQLYVPASTWCMCTRQVGKQREASFTTRIYLDLPARSEMICFIDCCSQHVVGILYLPFGCPCP
jgi:hypothetical protein